MTKSNTKVQGSEFKVQGSLLHFQVSEGKQGSEAVRLRLFLVRVLLPEFSYSYIYCQKPSQNCSLRSRARRRFDLKAERTR